MPFSVAEADVIGDAAPVATVGAGLMPVPDSGTSFGLDGASLCSSSDACLSPRAVGWKRTSTSQLAVAGGGATGRGPRARHVVAVTAKSLAWAPTMETAETL